MTGYKIIISGRVQGVNYRRFAKIVADRLGVKGYVKNLSNGDVEVVAEGDKKKIDLFLGELRKGNSYSHVDDMKTNEIPDTSFESFEIRY